jgi:hypothetical protein
MEISDRHRSVRGVADDPNVPTGTYDWPECRVCADFHSVDTGLAIHHAPGDCPIDHHDHGAASTVTNTTPGTDDCDCPADYHIGFW